MLVRDLQRRGARRQFARAHAGDVFRNGEVVRARMHRLIDEGLHAVKSARGFRRARPAAAAFDVPLEVEVRPVKARDQWIDHRGVLPGGEQLRAVDARKALRDQRRDAFVVERRVVAQPAPQQEMQPVFVDLELARRRGRRARNSRPHTHMSEPK